MQYLITFDIQLKIEGMRGIRPLVTLDVISNSPFVSKVNQRQFEGEFSSLSEVTWAFLPRSPSIALSQILYMYDCKIPLSHFLKKFIQLE